MATNDIKLLQLQEDGSYLEVNLSATANSLIGFNGYSQPTSLLQSDFQRFDTWYDGYTTGSNFSADVNNIITGYGYLTSISGQDLAAADNTNSAFITAAAIPTALSAFTNDSGFITSSALGEWNSILYPTDAAGVLTNDGSGNLSWGAGSGLPDASGIVSYEDNNNHGGILFVGTSNNPYWLPNTPGGTTGFYNSVLSMQDFGSPAWAGSTAKPLDVYSVKINQLAANTDGGNATINMLSQVYFEAGTFGIATSQLSNDSGFITSSALGAWNSILYPTDAAGVLTNDGSGNLSWGTGGAATWSTITGTQTDVNVGGFTNDAGYLTPTGDGSGLTGCIDGRFLSATPITTCGGVYIPSSASTGGGIGFYVGDANGAASFGIFTYNGNGYITTGDLPLIIQSPSVSFQGTVSGVVTTETDPVFGAWLATPPGVSTFTNDSGYVTSAGVPTTVSALTNDAGYITGASIPTNVSSFFNDAGYLTSAWSPSGTVAYQGDNVSEFTNDVGYATLSSIPTNVSSFTNDAGYLGTGSNISSLTNDAGFLSTETDPVWSAWYSSYASGSTFAADCAAIVGSGFVPYSSISAVTINAGDSSGNNPGGLTINAGAGNASNSGPLAGSVTINGGSGYNAGTSALGGSVLLNGGPSLAYNGGDVVMTGGVCLSATGAAATIDVGGAQGWGKGGSVGISAGSGNPNGGSVGISGGSALTGGAASVGGDVSIGGGASTAQGGNVSIYGGYGALAGGYPGYVDISGGAFSGTGANLHLGYGYITSLGGGNATLTAGNDGGTQSDIHLSGLNVIIDNSVLVDGANNAYLTAVSAIPFADNSSGANWAGTPPANTTDAINRIAAQLVALGLVPIP